MAAKADPKLDQLASVGDYVGLYKMLGPMWLLVCMEMLEDMLRRGTFFPNPEQHINEMRQAGINVPRMQVALAAALHKVARQMTWERFVATYKRQLDSINDQQQGEVRIFWLAADPIPGLSTAGPATASNPDNWEVTNNWEFDFEQDLDVGSYRLNNGAVIPMPPRGKWWPKRKTVAKFTRIMNQTGKVKYGVLLVPKEVFFLGIDSPSKFLLDQAAESMLSKGAALFIGGVTAPIMAGMLATFVPREIGAVIVWTTECYENKLGPYEVHGVNAGFNK